MNAAGQIGQYRLLRKIGAGGMGTVYLGEHLLLRRRAAIKMLLPALSARPEVVERFFNEARATSAILDAGVVQIFDFGYHVDGAAYIVMELLEGEALSARIDRLGTLPVTDALRIARQVASSLGTAHARGIIHRDLKPENIYLIHDAEAQGGERTKLIDFGICKVPAEDSEIDESESMLGTPMYMSPEQCDCAGRTDARSDLYTLGCVVFHMLTGRPPFDRDEIGELIAAHVSEEAPAPSELEPQIPAAVDALVARCLAKDPDDRYQSMTELLAAIEQALARISESGIAVETPARVVSLPAGWKSEYDASALVVSETPVSRTVARSLTPPSPRWPPLRIASEAEAEEIHPPFRSARAMVGIVLGAAVVSLVAVRLAMVHADTDDETPASTASAPVEPPAPAPAPAAARMTVTPIVDERVPAEPRIERPDPGIDRTVERSPAPASKPSSSSRARVQASASTEDLYETR